MIHSAPATGGDCEERYDGGDESVSQLLVVLSDRWPCGRDRVQVVLQDHGRCRSVESGLPLSPVLFTSREQALGFPAAEPFVLQDDGEVRERAQAIRERLNGRGLLRRIRH